MLDVEREAVDRDDAPELVDAGTMRAAVVQFRAHRSHRLVRNAPEVVDAGTMRAAVVQFRAHRSHRLVRNAPEVADAGTV